MDNLLKFVKKPRPTSLLKSNSPEVIQNFSVNSLISSPTLDEKDTSTANYDNLHDVLESPIHPKDPQMILEAIRSLETDYYSMTFDSGQYEIENCAGPTCRSLSELNKRLSLLDKQNKMVSSRVSELVLEKHPSYEAELNGVLSLQTDNLETLRMCRDIRSSLKQSANVLVRSRLTVLRNFRRRSRLRQVLSTLYQVRSLRSNVHRLDTLLTQGDFYSVIELHRKSLVTADDYRQYRCIESIQVKLKALGLRIEDLLDARLEQSCQQFSDEDYGTVQKAFELLGNTQTMFAQMQMHYLTTVQRRSFAVVHSFVTSPPSDSDLSDSDHFTKLCSQLPTNQMANCLATLCQNMWVILLCYERASLWHQDRASGKALTTKTAPAGFIMVDSSEVDFAAPDRYQLIRQWHDYGVQKLRSGRGRLWAEVSGRIEPILRAVGSVASEMCFDQIAFILETVNKMVSIGEEFSNSLSSDLLEVLRASINEFFKQFHRKHVERLRMFLENETWELCPVKPTFTILDLQEFRVINCSFRCGSSTNDSNADNQQLSKISEKYFCPPYTMNQFPLFGSAEQSNVSTSEVTATTDLPHKRCSSSVSTDTDISTSETLSQGPLLTNTTLEVLRLIGRYLQMMRLLRPISDEVMHCVCQVFDYYFYSIFAFFGPSQNLTDSAELPERLRSTLKRIGDRLIAPTGHASVLKGDRFSLPDSQSMHVTLRCLSRCSTADDLIETSNNSGEQTDLWLSYLQAQVLGVESVICLADMLDQTLLPHLYQSLPESKRGLTSVFREQSLMAARQLREPCMLKIVPHILNTLIPKYINESSSPPSSTVGMSLASGLSRLWPMHNTNASVVNSEKESGANTNSTGSSNEKGTSFFNLDDLSVANANPLLPHIATVQWTSRQVAAIPSPYIAMLHHSVFIPFSAGLQTLLRRLACGVNDSISGMAWNALLNCISHYLLDALGQVHQCSEEGRGQMLLDVQTLAMLAEAASNIQPFPKLDYVIEYIQAFYVPSHEWEHWLINTGNKYTRLQLTGLAQCIARGDKRQRQRLLNAINQHSNQSANTTTVANTISTSSTTPLNSTF